MTVSGLTYEDYRACPGSWATKLGVSRDAVDLYLESDVFDLHVDTFLWPRVFSLYDVAKRHRPWLPSSAILNQADLPRIREAALTGVAFDIVTNPFRRKSAAMAATLSNIAQIRETLNEHSDDFALCRGFDDYRNARASGKTAAFVAMQGGNGIGENVASLDLIPEDLVHRITVVHLTRSKLGAPNAGRYGEGLTDFGREFCAAMQSRRILVDLAHVNRAGFFDAVEATDPSVPLVVTHTGVAGVRPLWRNIDDEQLRVIGERGGTVGIVFHTYFLHGVFGTTIDHIVDHAEHIVRVLGEDFVSLGSDYDGGISLPKDLPDITYQPRIVQRMLERGWSDSAIKKFLGGNFLRVLKEVRP